MRISEIIESIDKAAVLIIEEMEPDNPYSVSKWITFFLECIENEYRRTPHRKNDKHSDFECVLENVKENISTRISEGSW